jgi:hypothetical protein
MKSANKILWVGIIFFCVVFSGVAFAADTFTVSGTVDEITTDPNMVAIYDDGVVTEVYGIKFSYLENKYNIVIETGMDISVEVYENLCYDGTIRLKATSITVGDATIELGTTGTGRGSGRGRNRTP